MVSRPAWKPARNIGAQVITDNHRLFRVGLHRVQRGTNDPRARFTDHKRLTTEIFRYRRTVRQAG